ncbi:MULTISPECIES: tetratricopeptide repeat protein [Bacillaceae]|uniref:Tetratricopeptide repeat protein n=1 Tax=Evansella alkalicola TaxID=745819 RepID=A0ABS6JZB9_9BACI|nr:MULTISPECIES: tetratricopeptide repeat protein [Bacillaceae]MBU9723936.1 tetratricopeptide repeat protein [Bacillus alkalicola]
MNDQLKEAIIMIENGQHEKALKKIEQLAISEDDETKRTIAELYYELGLLDRALPIVEELMFRYPDHGELFAFAAECYSELGKEEEAIDMLTEISDSDPSYSQAQMLLADIYQNQGLDEVAEQKLLQAVKYSPEEPIIQYGLGEFYLSRGDYSKSIPYFKKIIHSNKFSYEGLNPEVRLAEAYSATGQFEEALEYYDRGVKKNDDPEALFGYGYTALQLEEYETAIKQFSKLKEIDPNYTTLFPYLGKAFRAENRLDEAIDILSEGLLKDEYNEELYLEMAKVQFHKGNANEGKGYLEKVIAINPSNTSAVKELLLYFHESEHYDESLELLSFLADYKEYDPVFERFKGKALYETDDLNGAVEAYKEAIKGVEDDEELLEEAAFAFIEYGEKEQGILLLEKLLQLQPDRYDIEERLYGLKGGK